MKLLFVALACGSLVGCADVGTAGGTPISMRAINEEILTPAAARAQVQQQATTQALVQQTAAYQPQKVESFTQPDGTVVVYCRDLTDRVVTCRQLN